MNDRRHRRQKRGTILARMPWPNLEQRPDETIAEWCRRLDSYCNRGLEKTT